MEDERPMFQRQLLAFTPFAPTFHLGYPLGADPVFVIRARPNAEIFQLYGFLFCGSKNVLFLEALRSTTQFVIIKRN